MAIEEAMFTLAAALDRHTAALMRVTDMTSTPVNKESAEEPAEEKEELTPAQKAAKTRAANKKKKEEEAAAAQAEETSEDTEAEAEEAEELTIEAIRAAIQDLPPADRKKVRPILTEMGADKLSDLPEEDYPELMEKIRELAG